MHALVSCWIVCLGWGDWQAVRLIMEMAAIIAIFNFMLSASFKSAQRCTIAWPDKQYRERPDGVRWPVIVPGAYTVVHSGCCIMGEKYLTTCFHWIKTQYHMLSTANITMQFGAKPLFENISVKFGDGNRYGLIGANGCGKSTFMKILGGDLEPSGGNVMLDTNERLGNCARTSSRLKTCACSTWS